MKRRVKDLDGAARARVVRAFVWAAFPGLFMGVALAVPLSGTIGWVAFLLSPVLLTLVVAGATLAISEGTGFVVGRMVHPTGGPAYRDDSLARTLLLRGDPEGALDVLEEAVGARPGEAEPCLAVARLLRDELRRPSDALAWFRAAREGQGLSTAGRAAIDREMVALHRSIGDLAAALREAARMADLYAGTPQGVWAEGERDYLKARLLEE